MKFVCIDLGKSTKILHMEMSGDDIKIFQSVTVDMSRYVDDDEILNIYETVTGIVNHLQYLNIKTKNILLSVPNIDYNIENFVKVNSFTSDINTNKLFKKDGKKSEYIKSIHNFGQIFFENEYQHFSLNIQMSRDTSQKICRAFKQYGYNLHTITSKISAVISYAKIMDDSFDSNYKVVIDGISFPPKSYFFANDVLVKENVWRDVDTVNLTEYMAQKIENELKLYRIKNPKIVVLLDDDNDYESVVEKLTEKEIDVFDLKSYINSDYECKYGIAIGLALQNIYKIKLNLKSKHKIELSTKQLNIISRSSLIIASAFFIAVSVFSAKNYINISSINTASDTYSSLQGQVTYNQNQYTLLEYELDKINQAIDSKNLQEIIESALKNSEIYIASIDTRDMLTEIVVETDMNAKDLDAVYVPNNYIVRGYSKNTLSISNFADSLSLTEEFDYVKLNGIQKIPELEFYAFEIEVSI
ncbi:MAG: hypothetical protein R3Y09_03655 [Clostridia bacterium]